MFAKTKTKSFISLSKVYNKIIYFPLSEVYKHNSQYVIILMVWSYIFADVFDVW